MMLKLKLQYSGHLMRRVDSLEKTLMLVGIGGKSHPEVHGERREPLADKAWESTLLSMFFLPRERTEGSTLSVGVQKPLRRDSGASKLCTFSLGRVGADGGRSKLMNKE